MEQYEAAILKTHKSPTEPIIVLGKRNDYLSISETVEQAVENTRRYLLGIGDDQESKDLTQSCSRLDDLEFFDAAGQRLEPVTTADQLQDFVVKDYKGEIRYRIRQVYYMNRGKAKEGNIDVPEVEPLPDDSTSFEEFIQRLAIKEKELREQIGFGLDCSLWHHWWGHC